VILKYVPFFRSTKIVSLKVNSTFPSCSISHGILEQLLFSLTSKGIEFGAYLAVWNEYAVFRLPVDSILAWVFCFLAVDFGYYCAPRSTPPSQLAHRAELFFSHQGFHRMAHEINFLWGTHQVHHSSEELVRREKKSNPPESHN
jgi:alkylglycerol monooxygenase